MACRLSQQHHGEDVPGLFTTMSPHVLLHPLQGAPCEPRRINFEGNNSNNRKQTFNPTLSTAQNAPSVVFVILRGT